MVHTTRRSLRGPSNSQKKTFCHCERLVGPSETIPVIAGRIGLSQWQNVFFCEFDGPRSERRVVCTIISDE